MVTGSMHSVLEQWNKYAVGILQPLQIRMDLVVEI